MNLLPFVERLETLGLGTQGQTLFVHAFPAETSEGIMLRPRLTGAKIDHNLPGYLKFDFQMIVRGRSVEPTQALAVQAAKALKMQDSAIGALKVNYLRPTNVPVGYPISIGEMVEFNCNIEACVVDPEWV